MKFLGLDYGLKRVGVAVSDEEGRIAFPREILETDQVLVKLGPMITDEKAAIIIIGLPGKFGGKENALTPAIKSFAKELEKKYAVKTIFIPEIFTTKEAEKSGTRPKNGKLDASAAALILQTHLDRRNKQ